MHTKFSLFDHFTPELEIMSGEDNFEVSVRECSVIFHLNFQKVYWCSRLESERTRLLKDFSKNETILDLFCGVGPLSVRAAKKGCNVIANDLNPICYEYLVKNCVANKIYDKIICLNENPRKVVDFWLDFQNI